MTHDRMLATGRGAADHRPRTNPARARRRALPEGERDAAVAALLDQAETQGYERVITDPAELEWVARLIRPSYERRLELLAEQEPGAEEELSPAPTADLAATKRQETSHGDPSP